MNFGDWLSAPLSWRSEIECFIGSQSLANLFGTTCVLERRVRRRSLNFNFGVVQQVRWRIYDFHKNPVSLRTISAISN